MPTFPFTDPKPDSRNFLENLTIDPVIRSGMENGFIQTRTKFTTVPEEWKVIYRFLSDANKIAISDFFKGDAGFGALEFVWTNPVDATTPNVRFAGPPKYKLEDDGQNNWRVNFDLVEVP